MDTSEGNNKLYELAQVECRTGKHSLKRSVSRVLEPSHFRKELHPLALQATGLASLEDHQILPVFFTEEACLWLMKLPSLYWFWLVVDKAIVLDFEDNDRIEAAAVFRAMRELRAPRRCLWF